MAVGVEWAGIIQERAYRAGLHYLYLTFNKTIDHKSAIIYKILYKSGDKMVKKLLFKNFYSFYQETEVSFELGKKPPHSYYDIDIGKDKRLNKVIAVIGPNGAGKTHLLRPFAFLSWFITFSYRELEPEDEIPFRPHALHADEPSSFELHFLINRTEYKYFLKIQDNQIIYEALYKKTSRVFSYVFIREKRKNSTYQIKQQGFGFSAHVAKKVRGNASLLSAAYMNDVEASSKFIEYFSKFSFNLNVAGRENFSSDALFESASYFYKKPELSKKMKQLLCNFDLGLSDIEIKEVQKQEKTSKPEKIYVPFGVHESEKKKFTLSFLEESSGTQSAFVLLKRILPVLEYGGFAIIDEIDNDLHPHLLPHLLDLFKFEHTNPNDAQLIFTCHTSEILHLLRKHQIYLVEKTNLESEAWRLDQMVGLRADDNLYAKYHAGALGAIPNI